MPFPQVQTGLLTQSLKLAPLTAATYTANASDWVVFTGGASTVVTLPAAALGAVVAVTNQVGTFTVTVKTVEGAGNTIAGAAGNTGYVVPAGGVGAASTQAVFVSDGTNWQCVSR